MRGYAVGVAALVGVLAPGVTAGDSPLVLRLGTLAPEGSPYYDMCMSGARTIARTTKGAVRIKIFPAASMGDESQIMGDVQAEKLDGFAGSAVAAFDQLPEVEVFDLPYLLSDEAAADAVMPQVWPLVRKAVGSRGYEALAYTEIGFRHIGSKQPIATVADLQKTRIRASPTPSYQRFWKLAGVPASGVGLPQVVGKLEQGELDGFDSSITMAFAASLHLYAKHLTLTKATYQPGLALLGPAARKRIPPALMAHVHEGLDPEIRSSIRHVREVEAGLRASLPGLGVSVAPVADEITAHLEKPARTVRAEWRRGATPLGRELLDLLTKHAPRRN